MRFRPAKLAGSALERRVAETIREGDHGGKIVFREPLQTLPDVSLGRSVLQVLSRRIVNLATTRSFNPSIARSGWDREDLPLLLLSLLLLVQ
jgi:hypothetical protein